MKIPAGPATDRQGQEDRRSGGNATEHLTAQPNSVNPRYRTARQQHLAKHLHRCGPRPVLEALIAVDRGQGLDAVLEDFARLQPETYQAVGADTLPIDGGRR